MAASAANSVYKPSSHFAIARVISSCRYATLQPSVWIQLGGPFAEGGSEEASPLRESPVRKAVEEDDESSGYVMEEIKDDQSVRPHLLEEESTKSTSRGTTEVKGYAHAAFSASTA